MKHFKSLFVLALFSVLFTMTTGAQERRPIDNRHPAWLIHIDVWNNADPQKIINLIPEDIKPYVVLNLSMSCSYDKELNIYKKPLDALQTYRSWASVCCLNNMWFTCQPASGGHTHIPDNAANYQNALDIHESFFKDYKNFLGWNYAEQFWGFDEYGDKSSSSQTDRIKLFADLVPMHHKYGGFLTISFCGNIWSHALNPIGMMKRNAKLLQACKDYPEAILWLYKYTTSSCWHNNESVCIGPFISGLAKNYGVRYDNCGYNGALDDYLGENHGKKYPAAVGIPAVMEQMTLNGACVWDGPELIWTEDFRGINNTTDGDGYTCRNWGTYPTFDNIWVDMFRKVIDGTIYIPTREEVVERTKIALSETEKSGSDMLKYATPDGLYDGLYLQDNDPLNSGSSFGNKAGNYMSNRFFLKKTGRYQAIPALMPDADIDATAKTIQKRYSPTNTVWSYSGPTKAKFFDKYYPEVSTGDAFVARHHNELTCYFPYSYFYGKKRSYASIPLQYNTCDSLSLSLTNFSTILAHEYDNHIDLYLNNFRTDTTTAKSDIVKVIGAKVRPTVKYKKRGTSAAVARYTEGWDATTGTYTLTVTHNGPCELTVSCSGKNTEGRLTDVVDRTPLDASDILQPEDYLGNLIIEGEDMDYKSVNACVIDQYNHNGGQYRGMRGHSAMGFIRMGTNKQSSIQKHVTVKYAGKYIVSIKYQNPSTSSFEISASFAGTSKNLTLSPTGTGWGEVTFEAPNVETGLEKNLFRVQNFNGKDFYVDNVTFAPSPELIDEVTVIDAPVAAPASGKVVYYNLSGQKLGTPQRGVNIVRSADGKVRKILY